MTSNKVNDSQLSVEDWISRIKRASFVITDSFHGTAFCILFNKPFLTIANEKRGLSRFVSLLTLLGLENRLVLSSGVFDMSLLEKQIDWESVNTKIADNKAKSIEYLKNSLLV